MKVIFNNEELTVVWDKYHNGNTALRLVDANGFPYMTATTNDSDLVLEEGEILIKDYSENRGIMDALVEAGIVEDRVLRNAAVITRLLVTPS